tara:strand:+ start:3857 stop:5278 length:1422 start_codon:yes stop_codon:yes gene_type:complete
MAQIFGSIAITGMLAPTDSADTFSVYEDIYNRGGYRTVTTNTDLKQITRPRRKLGMMVHVTATGKTWILTTEPHAWDLQTAPTLVGNTDIAPYAPYTGVGGDSVVANANATGDWTELTTGGGGAGDFTGPSMELQVEGIAAGSSFTTVPLPNMWDNLLYPIHFTNFGVTGQSFVNDNLILKTGDTLASNSTFEWSNYHDSYINPSGTPDFILEALAPNAADIGGSPLTISNPTFGAGTYTSANSVLSGPLTSAVDALHEFKISATSTTGLTLSKNLKVFWRTPFYIGTMGYGHLAQAFLDANPSGGGNIGGPPTAAAGTNTMAQLVGAGSWTFSTAHVYSEGSIVQYALDTIPANFDYNVWYPAPDTSGTYYGTTNAPNGNEHRCIVMDKSYFPGLAGGAFVAGTSTISVMFRDGAGTETTQTLFNATTVDANGGTFTDNLEWTEGATNYIGFESGYNSGLGAAQIKILSFNP